jgi:diaminopimelate decarboxylase
VFREALSNAGPIEIAFAVKANPNLAVLRVLAMQDYGADVVSGGELTRALAAGIDPNRVVFSGVGKSKAEMLAAIRAGVGQFNIESEEEGLELALVAEDAGARPACALRINPDVDAATHAKISTGSAGAKFGVAFDRARSIYGRLASLTSLRLRGVAVHIGSQLRSLDPLEAAFARIGELISELRRDGHEVSHVDLGGGLGVPYRPGETLPSPADYGEMIKRVTRGWNVTLMFEPGRVIAGNAGVLLTRVIRVKGDGPEPFVVVDVAMNDLARPALYDAYHHFEPVVRTMDQMTASIVGPVCETGDTFARGRPIAKLVAGDLAIFRTAGAYGATMASTYNSRDLVPEVLVDGNQFSVVAERIPAATVMEAERVPDWLCE